MVTVFGLGFVGLTTALGFAHLGYGVYGVDVDEERKEKLRKGEIPFLEPGMEEALQKHLDRNFHVTEDIPSAIAKSDCIFYCVGTPYGKDGSADLSYLFSAIDTTLEAIRDEKFRVMVTKSTIPPSTTAEKILPYVREKKKPFQQVGIANNPEFLREGHCWEDFLGADRIVLGVSEDRSRKVLTELYRPMGIPIKCVTPTTGEFIKYLSNTLLATMVSYSNEMAQLADTIGDIQTAEAFRILHMDKRWGGCAMTSYVYPGCGYGGYCLPKDTNALLAQARAKGSELPILREVIATNDRRAETVAKNIVKGRPQGTAIGILGLSFKPGSDDVRDTPAARILHALQDMGYRNLCAYDPEAMEEFARHYPDIRLRCMESAEEVYQAADVLAIVTAWEEFRSVKELGSKPVVDCRYML